MKTTIIISILALIAFFLGRELFSDQAIEKQSIAPQMETLQNDQKSDPIRSESAMQSQSLSNSNMASDKNSSTYQSLIEHNKFADKHQKLSQFFSKSEIGQEYVKMFTFMSMQEIAGSAESKLVDEAWDSLKENPYEAIKEFDQSYQNISDEFINEITDSIQLLSRFDIDESDKFDFLSKIIKEPITSNARSFIPIAAFFSLRSIESGKDFIKENIDSMLKSHQDNQEIVISLIHEYAILFPEDGERLKASYLKPGFSKH